MIKKAPYHLNIIDGNVKLPSELQREYDNPEEAYEALGNFVHTFDGKLQVDGRVIDCDGNDWDYSSSII